ncbi:MAG TPA: hypothetical protein PLX20_11455 [Rhodocyclaceae bacterium]|nr:hypothetical protein [Rhodocyclaceae bacterium]HNH13746.1 hypothetical protein [Rhodocyclaceae bacterium]HNH98396.1 hypothetical protein [Rhodocyclaceae bacterium]
MEEKLGTSSASSRAPSQAQKPDTSSASNRLTNSEIEQLRRDKKELSALARKAFRQPKQA